MRILVLQESDWVERGPHHHHLIERLSARGHEVRVIDFEIGWKSRPRQGFASRRKTFSNVHKVIEEGGVTVIRPAFIRLPIIDYLSTTISHSLEIRKQLRDFRPDIVLGFGLVNAAVGLSLARRRGIPFGYFLIDTLHRLVPEPALHGVAKVIEQGNLRRASIVFSFTQALRDYTIAMGASPEKSLIVHVGVDLERYRSQAGRFEVRRQYRMGDGDIVLLFVGWLYTFSGLKEVAEAVASRPHGDPEVRLLIVGKGELAVDLSRIAAASAVANRIVLVDWQPYPELPKYVAAADIGLLPAYANDVMRDIVPSKVYEYMAAGKPVIATRLPGLVKEFPGGQGIVFVDRPADAVSKAIELAGKGLVASLGEEARTAVARYDWTRIADGFERLLERIAAGETLAST